MTTKELQQKRTELAKKLTTIAKSYKDNGNKFKDDAEHQEWDRLNADYDQVAESLSVHDRDRFLHQPINPLGIGLDDAGDGVVGGRLAPGDEGGATGLGALFRDLNSGREIRALTGREQMSATVRDSEEMEPAERVRVGAIVAALATNDHGQLNRAERMALQTGEDKSGGYMLSPQIGTRVIDLARSASVAMRAGAQTLPMDGGTMHLVKVTGDPTATWRRELTETRLTQPTLGKITLEPKMLTCIVPLSLEVIEDAANIVSVVEQLMQSAMGLALDRAILMGTGNEAQPKGITQQDNIQTVTGVGTPTNYAKVTNLVGKILQANYPGEVSGLSWIQHPRDAEIYDLLLDTTGQPKAPTAWASALKKFYTTSLPTTEGGGNNESTAIVGDFSQVIVGMRTRGVMLQVFDAGAVRNAAGDELNAVSQFARFVRAYLRADVALVQPTWLGKLTGITTG